MEVFMRKQSFNTMLIAILSVLILLSGGLAQAYLAPDYGNPALAPGGATPFVIGPGVLADYLTNPNWAFTPPLRKFVDPLPGLCVPSAANSYCASTGMGDKNIPVAVPDIVTYPGSDYYVIELHQYSEMMHSDLVNPTTLRGYLQNNNGTDTSGGCADPSIDPTNAAGLNCTSANNTLLPAVQHFLGPVIVATKDRPVRVLFRNKINPAVDGNLFLPIDDTIMGSGAYDINYNPTDKTMNAGWNDLNPLVREAAIVKGMFSTNRATLHLHGGRSPWISDGTPHQWITPDIGGGNFEDPIYPQGISVNNVPDMPTPAVGEQTFYWTNQQSSRMMFYHDHAWGITRLNVYAGEAAGYLIRDTVEQNLISSGVIPAAEIPLVIMDKTFVDPATIGSTDPTWNWGTGATTTAGVVTFVNVSDGGSGYTTVPAVTITEGANTSASATAVVTSVVSSITVDPLNKGLGYFAPLVIIDDPVGVGATADATIDGTGAITGIIVTNGGSGYNVLVPPTVTIFDQNNDVYTPAVATAAVSATVTSIAVANGGSGYINPVVAIDPPAAVGGTQALASATVTDIKAVKAGDLWWPHVYMPAQNPFDVSGIAPMGRWAYGPYFYPATNNLFQPIPNPYYDPLCDPLFATEATPGFHAGFCQAPEIPSTPNPSWGAEAFMDTPLINGTAYPFVNLEPQAYRLRILNAAHDRFMNLSMYIADGTGKEAPMVAAAAPLPWDAVTPTGPATWPVDGRPGGVPDWTMRGPDWVMIGSEGGFLPMPVVIPSHPVTWNVNPSMFNVGNINGGSLILGPAERADVIVDFSDPKYQGKTLILYNDGSAPWPALNPQYDFYTGNPDGSPYGSAPSTVAGFGPNMRTIMQINICTPGPGCVAGTTFDVARLTDAFDPTTTLGENGPGVFQMSQEPMVAAQGNMNPAADPLLYEASLVAQDYSAYSRAYGTVGGPQAVFPTIYPNWGISRINDSIIKFKTIMPDGSLSPTVTSIAMKRKAMHDEMGATFDDYGRMRAGLGLEKNNGGGLQVNFIVQTYSSPVTEDLVPNGIQVWKISHNGVDTHPIHFHLFDVQILNRVGWDGFIRLPDPSEMGWKETVRISPLEDTIIAIRPIQPALPFGLPTSYRPLNPATPIGSTVELTQIDPITGNARVMTNDWKDFAWEYVWHCHILSHEENDMMRSIAFHVVETAPAAPDGLVATPITASQIDLTWVDRSTNEFQFRIERGPSNTGPWSTLGTTIAQTNTGSTGIYHDMTIVSGTQYWYRVVAVTAGFETPSFAVNATAMIAAAPAYLTIPANANGNGSVNVFAAQSPTPGAVYNFEYRLVGAPSWTTVTNPPASGTRNPTITLPPQPGTYEFRVAVTAAGFVPSTYTAGSNTCVFSSVAVAPASLAVPATSSTGNVYLIAAQSPTPGVPNYVFEYKKTGDVVWQTYNSGAVRNPTITGLSVGTWQFRVYVTAVNFTQSASTAGNQNCVVGGTTPAVAPSSLSVPATATSAGNVNVIAAASSTPGAVYNFEYKLVSAPSWTVVTNPAASGTRNPTIPGFVPGTYQFRVYVTAAGYTASTITAGNQNCVVSNVALTPGSLSIPTSTTTGNIYVIAGASATPGISYQFEYSTNGGGSWTAFPTSAIRNPTLTLPAASGATYRFRVRAIDANAVPVYLPSAYRAGNNTLVW